MPRIAHTARRPMQQSQAGEQRSKAISLACSVFCSFIDGGGRHLLGLDGAHLRKDLSCLCGLALGAKNQSKLIMCSGVMVMRKPAHEHLFGAGVILFCRVGPAQLWIGWPEIGLAVDCRL